jgi:hypothetical protein
LGQSETESGGGQTATDDQKWILSGQNIIMATLKIGHGTLGS